MAYLAQSSSADADSRHITTHLFPAFSKTGNRKTLTMRKTEDFDLEFSYRKTGSPSCVSPLSLARRQRLTRSSLHSDAYLTSHLFTTHLKGISSATANVTAEQLSNATVRVSVELDPSGLVKVGKAVLVLREEDESKTDGAGGISDKLKNLLSKFGSSKNATASASSTASAEGAQETPASGEGEAEEKVGLTDEEKEALEELKRQAALPPAQVRLDVEQREPQNGGAAMNLDEKADIKKRCVSPSLPFLPSTRAHQSRLAASATPRPPSSTRSLAKKPATSSKLTSTACGTSSTVGTSSPRPSSPRVSTASVRRSRD